MKNDFRLGAKGFWRAVVFFIGLAAIPARAADVLVSQLLDNPDPAIRGGEITYTIQVQNQQADTATNVVLTFPIPATTTFVSVDHPDCALSGSDVVCNFGNLLGTAATPPGPVETVNVVIRTGATTGGVVNVQATVTADADTNPGNDQRDQNTTIDNGADLTPTLSASPDPVPGSELLNYTLTVSNLGPNDATNPVVVIDLSPNLTYISGSASGTGWSCSYSSGSHQLSCTRANLTSSTSAPDITFQTRVTGGVTGGTITSTTTVSSDTGDPDPNNNVDTADVTISEGTDLAVTGSASPSSVIEGDTVTLTLQPRNNGPMDATNVTVTYNLPAGFTISSGPTGPGWSCSVSGTTVTCSRASYSPGATDDITLDVVAPNVGGTPTDFNNTVSIASDTHDGVASNDSDTFTLHVDPDGVDLAITKSKSPQPVAQGSPITATISVHNNGPRDAVAGTITVTDTLAAGETFVSVSGTNWSCNTGSLPTITCTYNAALASGADTSDLVIQTTATSAGDLTDTATVSYSDTPPDYNSSNDTTDGTVTSTSTIADLVLTKTADADNSDGDISTLSPTENTVVYTLTVTNNGPDAADGIELRDPIPGYVSGQTTVTVTSAPANYSCTTGSTVVCTQTSGSLASSSFDSFVISVTRPLLDGAHTNNASAYSSTVGDNDRSNNTASVTVQVDPVADLAVQSKTVTPNPVRAGVEATYVITIRNNGPSTAQNVQVVDSFNLAAGDTGFTFISANPSVGTCSGLTAGTSYTAADSPQLTCNLGNIARNHTETITLVIRPNHMDSPPSPRTIDNSVQATTTTYDNDTTNNTYGPVTLTVDPSLVDLLINNADTPDPLGWDPASGGDNANNDVTYDVRFTNRGPSYATGVYFDYTMTPKAGKTVRFECDEAAAGDACGTSPDTCTVTSGSNPVTGPATLTLRCTATTVSGKTDEMTANSTGHRYLRFRVLTQPDSSGDTHATNATIAANENETQLTNNAESEDTSVRARVDLVVQKNATPGSVQLGEPFVWTITVTNDGPLASQQTDLNDTLPAGMAFHGATPTWSNATDGTNGSCTTSGQDLHCDLGAMSVGASAVIQVPVMITSFTGSPVQNCATATTDGVDPDPANSTDVCGNVTVLNSYYPADYGDAPDTTGGTGPGDYATTLAGGGPRHLDPGGTWLGDCVDSDGPGTQQNADATADDANAGTVEAGTCTGGDDEDGVTLPPALVAGTSATLDVKISGATCALDGWIDFNADGDFDDAGEQIFTARSLAVGTHSLTVAVPAGLTYGTSYARFRCSAAGGLSPVEETTGGEVEDYKVSLQPNVGAPTTPTDYGDAPDPATGTGPGNYRTLLSDDGASHVLGVANAPYLGSCVDSDPTTHQNSAADADDQGAASGAAPTTVGTCTTPGDDEDGVVFNNTLVAGAAADIDVTASSGTDDCVLNAWIDFNGDGDFADAGEQIATDLTIASGTTANLTPVVPAGALVGPTYARFRCSTATGLSWRGAAPDGEVEDYRVEIHPDLAATPADFGDAPDPAAGEASGDYATTSADNGPAHVLDATGPWLGACVDSDTGTAQAVDAHADDNNPAGGPAPTTLGTCATAGDDEDGAQLVGALIQGATARVAVTVGGSGSCVLNAWFDFDHDGRFESGAEQVIQNQTQAAGTTVTYSFNVPTNAQLGDTYVRLRCSTTAGLGPTGPAPDGEVEDYFAPVLKPKAIPALGGWGLWLLALLLSGLAAGAAGRRSAHRR